jgi:hypothetical protein
MNATATRTAAPARRQAPRAAASHAAYTRLLASLVAAADAIDDFASVPPAPDDDEHEYNVRDACRVRAAIKRGLAFIAPAAPPAVPLPDGIWPRLS